jgi:hypothetical protein
MFLVMILISIPSVFLLDVSPDTKQMVALIALFAGVLIFIEYHATYPSLIEFRDAAPFNRVRFGMLFGIVFCLSTIERGRVDPSTLTQFVEAVGTLIGMSLDFPFSPVRLATLMVGPDATDAQLHAIRAAAGISFLVAFFSIVAFLLILKTGRWPTRGKPFNVWVNLPTFDPAHGTDVVTRLIRDSRINYSLGFLLPFLSPVVVLLAAPGFEPMAMGSPQALIWVMTAWAFLPASLFMRGIAMGRVAEMILEKREANVLADSMRRYAPA